MEHIEEKHFQFRLGGRTTHIHEEESFFGHGEIV